jgi:AcrR family transcriptional regulator
MLEQGGLDAVTLRGLGAAAGVSRSAPYRHFSYKEELLASVAAEGMRALREAMVRAAEGAAHEGPLARIEAVADAYVEAALARPAHYRLIFGAELSGREHPKLIAEGSAAFGLLAGLLREAQVDSSEEPEATVLAAGLLWSTVHGLVDLILSGHASAEKGLADPRAVTRLAVAQALPPDVG